MQHREIQRDRSTRCQSGGHQREASIRKELNLLKCRLRAAGCAVKQSARNDKDCLIFGGLITTCQPTCWQTPSLHVTSECHCSLLITRPVASFELCILCIAMGNQSALTRLYWTRSVATLKFAAWGWEGRRGWEGGGHRNLKLCTSSVY